MIFVIGGRSVAFAEQTSNLTFSAACKGSGTADDNVEWKITSDAAESTFESKRGIHYGTSSKAVSYLTLTTSDITGSITKIVVNASGASKTSAKLDVTVGGTTFGSQKSLTSSATEYTFEGIASGEIAVKLSQSSAQIALYVKSISVTYSTGSTTTATLTGISVTGTAAELWTGDDFTHDGIKVTATYDDNSEKDVTNSCTYSDYDMSKVGSQTVNVSYGEKTTSYTVNVKTIGNIQETAYTATEAIEIIDAGKGLKTPVYVKGKVSEIASAWTENNGYLSFWVSEDGTENKFEMYKNYKGADNEVYTSEEECPKVGDDVICYGTLTKYITKDNTSYYVFSEGNYLVEKTTVVDNRTTTTVTFGEDVDDQTFNVNLGETFVGKTATVTPAEAGNVTYSSDNAKVASVDESTGAITIGNTAGTATITASFAETDTYKASSAKYYINVIDPNALVFYESFNQNKGTGGNDGIWYNFTSTSTPNYDNSGWTVGNVSGARQCVKIGTSTGLGSAKTPTIDLSGDKYILTFKAGAWSDDKTTIDVKVSKGTLSYNGKSSSTQTITMADAAWTDYTMTIAGATNNATITFTARVASNNRFFLDEVKIVKAQASEPTTSGDLTFRAQDSDGIYYATFSSDKDVVFTKDVIVYAVSVADNKLSIEDLTPDYYEVTDATVGEGTGIVEKGFYVPKNNGVLISCTDASAKYYFPKAEQTNVTLPANQLKPAPAEGGEFTAETGYQYYKLAYDYYDAKTGLGFYLGAADGGAFSVKAGTAYLAVPPTSGSAVKGFSFDGTSTGISAVDAEEPAKTRVIYNIAGQKVNAMTKAGLYIVNGKKYVNK